MVRCSNCGATPPDGDAAGWALPRSADDETPPLCGACFAAAVFPSAEAFAIEHEGTGSEPVASRFKTDRPTGDDRAIANKAAAALGVPDDAEWWMYATIVRHPLDGEIAARLLPIMAEEQRILAQLLEVRERLRVEREKVEGLRFVEVEVP